ncbi:hypothetical protein D3C80_2036930 [compost metagenome]
MLCRAIVFFDEEPIFPELAAILVPEPRFFTDGLNELLLGCILTTTVTICGVVSLDATESFFCLVDIGPRAPNVFH